MSKPTVIITTLEDSVPWLDQRLVSAYLRTTYQCFPSHRNEVFDLRIGQPQPTFERWLTDREIRQFAFLTAWNPGSQPLPVGENERRNRTLEKELQGLAQYGVPGRGIGDDKQWPPEAGFFALGISAERAVALGQKFGQNALVFGQTGGVPELWWLPDI